MSKWLQINDFAEKYDLKVKSVSCGVYQNQFPSYVINKTFIDEDFFIRRKQFRKKIWLEAHDNYYFFALHSNDEYIAYLLNKIDPNISIESWINFIDRYLFINSSEKITNYKISEFLWKFHKYSRWLIRGMFIKRNKFVPKHKRKPSMLLDKY